MNRFIFKFCCLFLVIFTVTSSGYNIPSHKQISRRRDNLECFSSEECGFDSCCVLGMGRFSVPTCQSKLLQNEYCRPASDEPINTTVTYFHGETVSLENIHLILCPCASGLSCERKTGKCEAIHEYATFNDLHDTIFDD